MNKKKIGIIDYGIGNLLSVQNAVLALGHEPLITENIGLLSSCDCNILPGVGAFKHGMNSLKNKNLIEYLKSLPSRGIPTLCICLGMQMLAKESYEFGKTEGLNLISGSVKKIKSKEDKNLRLPHVGFSPLIFNPAFKEYKEIYFKGINDNAKFYFIHSYAIDGENKNSLANVSYYSETLSAIVINKNIIGTQFHPEKSGKDGLKFIYNFINNEQF